MLLTGGTLVQLIFWTILLAWLVLSADTITVMQLCCCCCCRRCCGRLARLFPCALQFPLEAPPAPQLPGSPRARPRRRGPGNWDKRVRKVCATATREYYPCVGIEGHNPVWALPKTTGVQKFWVRKRAGRGKRAGARREEPKKKAAANPQCWLGREGARGTGTVTPLGKTSCVPPPKPGIWGTGVRGNFPRAAAAAKLPRLISPLGLQ